MDPLSLFQHEKALSQHRDFESPHMASRSSEEWWSVLGTCLCSLSPTTCLWMLSVCAPGMFPKTRSYVHMSVQHPGLKMLGKDSPQSQLSCLRRQAWALRPAGQPVSILDQATPKCHIRKQGLYHSTLARRYLILGLKGLARKPRAGPSLCH